MSVNSDRFTMLLTGKATDSQAAKLQKRLLGAGLKVHYQEEQHGPDLLVRIRCGYAQADVVRGIMRELGIPVPEREDDDSLSD